MLLLLNKIMAKSIKHKATILWNRLPNTLKKVLSIKKFTQKVKSFCSQQAPIVRNSSLVYNVTNYNSVTDTFQHIVDLWYMLLVNDGDDVNFSLAVCTILCSAFFWLCVRVCMIN